jgi:hypothetical protein
MSEKEYFLFRAAKIGVNREIWSGLGKFFGDLHFKGIIIIYQSNLLALANRQSIFMQTLYRYLYRV